MISKKSIELYQVIADKNEERVFKHWHASSLSECPRAHYFKRRGVLSVNKPGAGKVLRWQAGHALEEAVRPHVEACWPNVESNVRVTDKKLDLTGEYDNRSEDTIIEVKSVSVYAFKESKGVVGLKEQLGFHDNGNRKWGIREEPYLHHRIQNHAYALMLDGIEQIEYIYISLDGRIATYKEKVSSSITDLIHRRLVLLNDHWSSGTPPACICHEKDHPLYAPVMQWCDYKTKTGCCSLDLIK